MHDDELAIWLGIHSLGNAVGYKRTMRMLECFESIGEAWKASRDELLHRARFPVEFTENFISKRKEVNLEYLLNSLKKSGMLALPYTHQLYPFRVREIHDPPLVLFVNGNLHESDFNHVISVVGTRRPTSYGQKLTKDVARELSACGAVIASGLAIGVDSLAHWGAIEGGGRTVAVVATGPDICYPNSNRQLMKTILDGHGVIMSEYFPGTTPEKWHFPARNRIVSGLGRAVVVVEAGENSGALITAKLGFEQNREVFAFPGRVDSPVSVGTNNLIFLQTARMVRNAKDILEELEWVKTTFKNAPAVVELFGREKEVYEMLSNEPIHFDVLCSKSGMNAGEMSATLTMLELAGVVTRQTGDWYTRQEFGAGGYQQLSLPQT